MRDDVVPIKVAIVEDDILFQGSFIAAIELAPDMVLHGATQTVAQAMRLLSGPSADVLVVDLGLPDGSGINVIRAAQKAWPDCAIMVSTTFADDRHVIPSIEAGATGYLLKDSSSNTMAAEIRCLHSGGSPISPRIARRILVRFRPREAEQAPQLATPLSPRERQTLEFITKGFSYDEIADLMGISRNTVMTFVRRIYEKLEVSSKTEAIFEARSHGII